MQRTADRVDLVLEPPHPVFDSGKAEQQLVGMHVSLPAADIPPLHSYHSKFAMEVKAAAATCLRPVSATVAERASGIPGAFRSS